MIFICIELFLGSESTNEAWTKMSCCSLEIQVRIISITSLIVTGLSLLNILKLVITGYVGAILSLFFHDHFLSSLFVQLVVFIVHLITYILCLIATIKRNKYMLIPFLIVTVLHIIFFISVSIYFVYLAVLIQIAVEITDSDAIASLGGVLIVLFLIPMTFASAVSVYSLVIVAKYYQEMENENRIIPPTITIQQCTPRASAPDVVLNNSKEIATIYDPTINPSAPPTQEPPPYY